MVALFVCLLIGGLALAAEGLKHESYVSTLPAELKESRLVMAEKTITRREPVWISGRPDEVRSSNDGDVIIETKNPFGRTVFAADELQVACYAYILRGLGRRVAPYAFIRLTKGTGKHRFVRIKTGSDFAVSNAYHRLIALRKGQIGRANGSHALCRTCGHQPYCHKGDEQ